MPGIPDPFAFYGIIEGYPEFAITGPLSLVGVDRGFDVKTMESSSIDFAHGNSADVVADDFTIGTTQYGSTEIFGSLMDDPGFSEWDHVEYGQGIIGSNIDNPFDSTWIFGRRLTQSDDQARMLYYFPDNETSGPACYLYKHHVTDEESIYWSTSARTQQVGGFVQDGNFGEYRRFQDAPPDFFAFPAGLLRLETELGYNALITAEGPEQFFTLRFLVDDIVANVTVGDVVGTEIVGDSNTIFSEGLMRVGIRIGPVDTVGTIIPGGPPEPPHGPIRVNNWGHVLRP